MILVSSVFPAACRFLSFWSRNLKSSGKNSGSGELEQEKQLRISDDFSLEETQKNAFLTHTCFQARRWWELETQLRPLAILVFSWGYTCVSPCFCWNTSRMSRFLRNTCIDVEIHLEHIRVYNHFLCLCAETHMYLLVLEVWNLETHARFLVFFSKKQEAHARSTPACSHLLLNNRKRQDLKSCSVPLCAITFQLQPFFPWNCASLEQKKCPAIQNIRCQAKKWLSLPTLCFFF